MLTAYLLSYAASFLQALFLPMLSLYASTLGLSEAEAGVIAGVGTFLYVPVSLSSEVIARRYGYRSPMAAALFTIAAGYAFLSVSKTSLQLLVAASLVSFGYGIFWPSVEKAVSASGGSANTFSISWSAGSLTGAIVISPLLQLGFEVIYITCSLTALSLTLLPLKLAKRSLQDEGAVKAGRLWHSWILSVGYSTSAGGVLTYYPLLAERLGLPGCSVSLVVFIMMAARTATFYILREAKPPAVLSIPLLLAIAAAPFNTSVTVHAILAAAAGAGQGIIYTLALEEIFNAKGAYTSLFEAFIGLGYSVGPLFGSGAKMVGFEPLPASAAAASLLSIPGLRKKRSGFMTNSS